MLLKCEEDSYLKEFTTKVVSCGKAELNTTINGQNTTIGWYGVELENTILFPEGGGQPSDHGMLNDQKVYYVARKGETPVHYVEKEFQVGEEIKQVVDWKRRFDHMQQHSGQHLITAIIDKEFQMPTVSWWLGEEVCHVELDTPSITQQQINKAEKLCNELIVEGRKVWVDVYKDVQDIPEELLQKVRNARGLPVGHSGEVRVVNIEGVEGNMCCGTHVKNLNHLQMVKFLHSEKSKRKDKTLLYFLVGNRIAERLSASVDREQKLTVLLKNNPAQHVDLVDKLQRNVKILNKNLQTVLKDLAVFEAQKIKNLLPTPKFYSLHRKEADPDFMNIVIKEVGNTGVFLFLSTGDEKESGNVVLYGDEMAINILGQQVCELLEGKGAGKGNKFQAKVTKMGNRCKAEKIIELYFRQ